MDFKKIKAKEKNLQTRARVLELARDFFNKQGFLEVATPSLVPNPGQEPNLAPVKTFFLDSQSTERSGYLITSPEYCFKKMLAAGYEKVYEIAKCFRGAEPAGLHNIEFTMLEWYRRGADYRDIMKDTEELCLSICKEIFGGPDFEYGGVSVDLSLPWPRASVKQLFEKYCGLDLDKNLSYDEFARSADRIGVKVTDDDDYSDIFFKIFLSKIEPNIDKSRPLIVYDYPKSEAALARLKSDGPNYAERFEVYIAGLEIANAFSELADSQEQKERLLAERAKRRARGMDVYDLDSDFLQAVELMGPAAGIALGLDRLIMLMTGAADISEVITFSYHEIFK